MNLLASHNVSIERSATPIGAWGDLEYVPIVISPPLDFVTSISCTGVPNDWLFPGLGRHEVELLLNSPELTSNQRHELLNAMVAQPTANGVRIVPPAGVVATLSPKARARIYRLLGEFSCNPSQNNAFRFSGDSVDEWIGDAGLAPTTVDLVRPYIYTNGSMMFFADWEIVFPHICDAAEQRRLISALAREVTVLMKLRVGPTSDLSQIIGYWGRGRRNKDIRPIIESLARCKGGQLIDIVHLLPPFARRLLYTYPPPPATPSDAGRDCHWTSLNFFNEAPDDRFLDLGFVKSTIGREYYRLDESPGFGDLTLFCDSDGEVFHSATYIADDIVFTKNGSTILRPWMLMPFRSMLDFYPCSKEIDIRFYRRR